jgi:predicted dehydrogenase
MSEGGAQLRWGIIGPGEIARTFAGGVAHSERSRLVAIASRDPGRPELAANFPGVRVIDGYEQMLTDPEVDAVYVATPHPAHAEWAIRCAEAGKHVLVEKPIAMNAYDADAIFHAARKAGTFAAEGFMYRLHPMTHKIIELVAGGALGEVRAISTSFGFRMPSVMPEHRLYAPALGGGGILDVGCYVTSISRLIAGTASGKPFLEPTKVSGVARIGETGVDEWAAAVLEFENGIVADVSCAISVQLDNVLRIYGSEARLEVPDFWFASGRQGGTQTITIVAGKGGRQVIPFTDQRWLYSFEADAAADAIAAGRQQFDPPGVTWADTIGNMMVLDKWRADAGLVYESETMEKTTTVSGRVLRRGGIRVPRRAVPGLPMPVSVAALGFESFRSFSGAANQLDTWFEAGGNLFDTAWVYQAGKTETHFGEWQQSRGVRDEVVLIGKGAHSPLVYPDVIATQLDQSLERLRTDYVDIYFMHRDNPDVPVGEFVDAMDAEVAKGRIRHLFGGSNWSMERLDEAIAYAERAGKRKPGALSNNLSLARMLDVIWAGCVTASGPGWEDWLKARQLPNFAWSSQGRGFFTDRAGRE